MTPKLFAYILVLRWVIGLIFILNGMPKFSDPSFGSQADVFFTTLRDDVIFKPYLYFFDEVILPNAFLVAKAIKYTEVALGVMFLINIPITLAVGLAVFLHLNYLCIASLPTFMFLNILMIASEFTIFGSKK
jgi:uncharacterized membrane protein YphA (DoxX/SURF4 family)